MKRCNLFFLIIFFVFPFEIWAQGTDNTKSDDGSLLHYSNFSASVEFTTKYMWRGIEYGTSPVFLPMLSYDYKGLNVYAMGGYATNGSHQEVDFGISYNYKWLTIGVNDYYYPTAVGEKDNYFVFKNRETGHYVEAVATIMPQKLPVYLLLSSYIFGADKRPSGNQAFSSYMEIGYIHQFKGDNSMTVLVGAEINKGFYTSYEKKISVCNVAAKYVTSVSFGKYKLPVSASLVFNPYKEKAYFTFSAYLTKVSHPLKH